MTTIDAPPHVVADDISLTTSGFAWPDRTTATHGRAGLTSVGTPLDARAAALGDLAQDHLELITSRKTEPDLHYPALVVIEGLPTSGTRSDSERSYLWWEVIRRLSAHGVPVLSVPPTTVKLYMTGMGNANKREVIVAVRRDLPGWEIRKTSKTGKVLTTDDDNKADAVALMAIGCHLLGHPLVEVTPYRERALEKLILPAGVRHA